MTSDLKYNKHASILEMKAKDPCSSQHFLQPVELVDGHVVGNNTHP